MKLNIEKQKEHFKNHIATFSDYGNIKILDFKAPGTSHYRIRFLFEEDYCRCHISGDLGELIATNFNNMTYAGFKDFVNNTYYFEEKINCHNRPIYKYDEEKARESLAENFVENEWLALSNDYDWEDDDEARIGYIIDDILENFSCENGISEKGYEVLSDIVDDAWEFAYDLGKERTGILELYMLAFKLAQERLEEKEGK